jgi:hypothetical protein
MLWLGIKFWGIIGVALAWVLRIGIDMGLLFWMSYRLMPASPEKNLRPGRTFYLGLGVLLAAAVWLAREPDLLAKIMLLPVIIAGLAGLAWRYFLDDEEKGLVCSAKDKLMQYVAGDLKV